MKVPVEIKEKNADILIGLIDKYGNEFIECSQILYYVNDKLQFKDAGKIMIDRRDNYPKIKILSPDTGDYTETFQENSCIFTDVQNLDVIKIGTSYTPYKINKNVNVEVIITF